LCQAGLMTALVVTIIATGFAPLRVFTNLSR
jgi:hypothetical protein